MADEVHIAVFEGGDLVVPAGAGKGREVALALPLNRLIVKMVRVPAENRDDMVGYATPILKAMSPYPDEQLTVSCRSLIWKLSVRIQSMVSSCSRLPKISISIGWMIGGVASWCC